MNTIKQARAYAKAARENGLPTAGEIIDWLIADLEMITACYKTADRIAKDALAELAALKQQEPYKMEAVFDAASQRHKNAPLYLAAGAQHGNAEDLYVQQSQHLNCPACGGSGHVDDMQPVQTATQPLPECEFNSSFTGTTEGWVKQEHIGQEPVTPEMLAVGQHAWMTDEGVDPVRVYRAMQAANDCVSKTADPDTQADLTIKPDAQDQTELAFEAWWLSDGQFCRAGGGDYEKTFAWCAWEASLAIPVQAQERKPLSEDAIMDATRNICREFRWPSTAIDIWRLSETANSVKEQP